jgi:hypothetical protein
MATVDLFKVAKIDKDGDCIGCGGGGAHIDPACDVCSTFDVNNLTLGDYTFDVFLIPDGGGIGFTVYEKGETRDNDEARCVDIIVKPSPDPVSAFDVTVA